MGDELDVKPASRESRLVMVQLEPKAKKKRSQQRKLTRQNKDKEQEKNTTERGKISKAMSHFYQLMEAYYGREGPHGSSCA